VRNYSTEIKSGRIPLRAASRRAGARAIFRKIAKSISKDDDGLIIAREISLS